MTSTTGDRSDLEPTDVHADSARRWRRRRRIAGRVLGATAIATAVYWLAVRPWHLEWGASDEEVAMPLPGDELLSSARMQSTRAITIEAPAESIWPWLVQMGQGRGGLYSYDWLENLVGCDIHSLDTIAPTLQRIAVGDSIRLGPEGYPFFKVASIEPNRSLVLLAGMDASTSEGSGNAAGGSWAFVLEPLDARRTRLVVRLRGEWEPNALVTAANRLVLEPAHFIMERRMMIGIKERVEGVGSGERGAGSGEQGAGSGERGVGSGE